MPGAAWVVGVSGVGWGCLGLPGLPGVACGCWGFLGLVWLRGVWGFWGCLGPVGLPGAGFGCLGLSLACFWVWPAFELGLLLGLARF